MQTISLQFRLFVPAVIASATLAVVILAEQIQWHDWRQLIIFFGMIVVAISVRIPDPRGGTVSPSTVLSYLAIYLFNPATALLVVLTGTTIGYIISRGWIPWRAFFNGSQMGLSVAMGAFIYGLLGGVPQRIDGSYAYLAALAAAFVHHVANNFFVAYSVSRRRGTPFLNTWLNDIRDLFWPNLLSIPTAILLTVLYARVHYASVLGYLLLLPLQWLSLRLYLKRRQLDAQIVDGLVVATDVNFPLGRGHARRVADLAVAIAREMRLSETAVESTQFAALLHDVGMIGKDDLLERPVVTAEDAEGLRDHVRVGAEIARELPRKEIGTMILRHHERYDGTGYPDGLKGESIPLGARIIALAETVDSMASGAFPYSSPAPVDSIVASVTAEKGRAFDPEVADAFLRTVERGSPEQERVEKPRLGELPAK